MPNVLACIFGGAGPSVLTFTIDDLAAIECMAVSCRIMTCLARTGLRSELSE